LHNIAQPARHAHYKLAHSFSARERKHLLPAETFRYKMIPPGRARSSTG
jgi:hypothetical protein